MLGLKLYLVDQSGVFARGAHRRFPGHGAVGRPSRRNLKTARLCEQLEKANCELERLQHQLHETVEAHERELEKERRHGKQLWRQMCAHSSGANSHLVQISMLRPFQLMFILIGWQKLFQAAITTVNNAIATI